jgi:hypothetical protein
MSRFRSSNPSDIAPFSAGPVKACGHKAPSLARTAILAELKVSDSRGQGMSFNYWR